MVQFMLAIDHESPMFRQNESIATAIGQAISFGWIGKWVSVYADDDPFWKDLAKVKENEVEPFLEKNVARLPVAVQCDVADPVRLAACLSAVRLFVLEAAPGMVQWETLKYKDHPYVRISPAKGNHEFPPDLENIVICYTAVGDTLTVSLSEKTIQHTIDRGLAREKAAASTEKKHIEKEVKPWLGSSAALRVDRKILEIVNTLGRGEYQRAMQAQSWGNLPILNEWKRLYPDRDPVEVHRQVWGVELVCPGGGKYVWNEKYGTMESTVYGHPGEPKDGPPAPPVLSSFSNADFGLTFEHQGLRARAVLEREAAKAAKK
jgi:hypothetical protein